MFKIYFKNKAEGYVTLCDLGGFENAYTIYNTIFTQINSLPFFLKQFDAQGRYKGDPQKKTIDHFINAKAHNVTNGGTVIQRGQVGQLRFNGKPTIETTMAKNVQILYESFTIVESLLHLKYFYIRRNGVDKKFAVQKLEKGDLRYDIDKVFKAPQFEDVNHPSYSKDKSSKVRCLMVPIMNYLHNLNKDKGKITKHVIMTCLRPDKCFENKESLQFAASISSVEKTKTE